MNSYILTPLACAAPSALNYFIFTFVSLSYILRLKGSYPDAISI